MEGQQTFLKFDKNEHLWKAGFFPARFCGKTGKDPLKQKIIQIGQ